MNIALAQTIPFLVVMLFVQATIYPAFFPVALVAISRLTAFNERSIFAGTTMAIGVSLALGSHLSSWELWQTYGISGLVFFLLVPLQQFSVFP